MFRLRRSRLAVLALLLVSAGCATQRVARRAELAAKHGDWDAAVYYYLEALGQDPDNVHYRMALARARQKAAQEHFKRAMTFKRLGNLVAARDELKLAVQLDPTHQFAEQELAQVQKDLEILAQPGGRETLEEIKKKAREAKVKPPMLNPKSKEPITLSFPKPTPVKDIYRALGKAFGFNVLFDPKLRDNKITVELNDVTPERALEIVMQAAGHFYKVLDEHTIIVADDTPQNRRQYEDLVIKTFFLSNADVKDVEKLVRNLIESRRMASNEQLNAITIRDTADKVAIAERLININDKAKAEVLVEVELMEVNSGKLRHLGMNLTSYTFNLELDHSRVSESEGEGIYLNELSNISNGDWTITVPNLVINLIRSSTDAVTLAQPKLRVTEGEKASLVIGERRPIPVTSFNTSNTIGTGVVPLTSYQYQDVGIKIEVEPRVHHNMEITLRLKIEVSKKVGDETSPAGQVLPIIGTRTIQTVIRLKDGETSMLVGLLKEDESVSNTETPLFSDVPILGRLFTNRRKEKVKTDLVLTLTPHILRFPDIHEEDLAPLWVGTESRMSFYGSSPRVRSGAGTQGPFDEGGGGSGGGEDLEKQMKEDMLKRVKEMKKKMPKAPKVVAVPGRGKNLTPSAGLQSIGSYPGQAVGSDLRVGFQPEVLALPPGAEGEVVVTASGSGPASVGLVLSYDPEKLEVESVEPAEEGVSVASAVDGVRGLVTLQITGSFASMPSAAAVVRVRAKAEGVVPLVLSASDSVGPNGTPLMVSASGATVFVGR